MFSVLVCNASVVFCVLFCIVSVLFLGFVSGFTFVTVFSLYVLLFCRVLCISVIFSICVRIRICKASFGSIFAI